MSRNSFIFLNSNGHYFNVVDIYVLWVGEAMISVQGDCLLDVPEQRRMPYPHAGNCVAPEQGDCIACDDPITTLQR